MRAVLIGALLAALAGCSSASAPTVIRFGILATVDQLPVWVMKAEGIASRHGLVIEQSPPYAGGLDMIEALAADEIDIAYPGLVPAIAALRDGQIPDHVAIVGLTNVATPAAPSAALVIGAGVTGWADLAGQQIALHSVTSINAASFAARAAAEGLRDYEFAKVGFADMGLAVRDGTVAAAIMEEPWTTQSVLRGDGRILAFTQGEPPLESMPLTVIAVRAEIAADDALLRRFLRAHLEAVRFIADQPTRARALFAPNLAISEEVAQQLHLKAFPLDARLDLAAVRELQEVLEATGAAGTPVDLSTLLLARGARGRPRRRVLTAVSLAIRSALLVALAVLVAGFATAATAIVVGRDAIRAATLAAVSAGAEATGRAVLATLREDEDSLEVVAALPPMQGRWAPADRQAGLLEAPELRELLGRAVGIGDRFEFAALVRPSGSVFLVEPATLQADLAQPDVAFYAWFDELRSRDRVISDLHVSTITNRISVAVGVAVRDAHGALRGYLVGGLRVQGLAPLVEAGTGGYFAYLTDDRGLVVAHGRDPRFARSQSDFSSVPAVRLALAGEGGATEDHNPIEEEDRLVGYRSLAGLGWAVVYAVPSELAYRPAASLAFTIAAATSVLIILTAGVAMLVVRRSMAPISRLSVAATEIATGARSTSLPPPGSDEVGRLAGDFRRMIDAVDMRETELRARAVELAAANRELEAFTYSVSHDLRAPLRSIVGFGDILRDEHGDALDNEGRRVLDTVIRNAGEMAQLIDDLLRFAHTARSDLAVRPVPMASIVRTVAAELLARQPMRPVSLTVEDLPDAWGDPALLRQVWWNLLTNALKFTRDVDTPSVCVSSEAGPDEVRFLVRDNGVGFEQAYVGKLFQPFQRLHATTQFDGTGIGLAIVARIVQRHRGRVWAEGEPGKGATFGFALPLAEEGT